MSHIEQSISSQKSLGFTDNDTDEVRRLISDTSIYLLAVTMLASLLHLLFEALAFQSDISFWRGNKSLTGLSVRAVIADLASQLIIFLFLVDSNTSLLVVIPAGIGIVIQCWKVQKATGLAIAPSPNSLLRYRIALTRMESAAAAGEGTNEVDERLAQVSQQADRVAMSHLGAVLLPLVVGVAAKTLIMDKHASWYSWVLATLTSCVYVFFW